MTATDARLSAAKPDTKGRTVPSKLCPIHVPSETEIKVVRNPITAAAEPAICPIGSMAKALKLPNGMPMQKNDTKK